MCLIGRKHEIVRVRHELHKRTLTVSRREQLTPCMLRLTLAGPELAGFTSLSPDDHIKVFAPANDGTMERRDYTPRRFHQGNNELTVDFALHEGGPVTTWARGADPGDVAQIGGPRSSTLVPHDFDWWLLIGDETALPAIGRRIEDLPAGTEVTSIVAVTGVEEQQVFDTSAKHRAVWVHRPAAQAADAAALLAVLQAMTLPAGEGFIWIAAEGRVARALRQHALEVWHHPKEWLKAAGYWVRGQADAGEKFES